MSTRPPAQLETPRSKIAVLTWIALYPTITFLSWLLTRLTPIDLPLPVRTLVLTAVLVPAMVCFLLPALTRLFRPWLAPADSRPVATPRPRSPRQGSQLRR